MKRQDHSDITNQDVTLYLRRAMKKNCKTQKNQQSLLNLSRFNEHGEKEEYRYETTKDLINFFGNVHLNLT